MDNHCPFLYRSYARFICSSTHSYSLVWYDWKMWEQFIDWMALSGVNLMLAMTGQEQIQYKVFRALGLKDKDIRYWFNGPALLTWSRGQNEYGSGLLGPLPKSWMKDQWDLQRMILIRLRSLGITGQLPGFQGNVPVQLKALYNDTNMTEAGSTAWMDSLDPLFGRIADLWMQTLIEDFGTDHWYQLDGYFDGGTAPWFRSRLHAGAGIPSKQKQARGAAFGSTSSIKRDEMAYRRAKVAYQGLSRTDPDAVWSYQGWQIIGWDSPDEAATLKGFVDGTPRDKFVIIDMSTHGEGQWRQFNGSSFFGAQFVWTALHNFGGTDGMKGDLFKVNHIPFDSPKEANAIGIGATPEGIDQNTIYYEYIYEQAFRDKPLTDVQIKDNVVDRAYRRYGLLAEDDDITRAWSLLANSAYAIDLGVQDGTGVAHLPAPTSSYWAKDPWFEDDRYTPAPILCRIHEAWGHLIHASEGSDLLAFDTEPFIYDLVNTGREVLANIATPASLNFSDAFSRPTVMDKDELIRTGSFYIELLKDIDTLVSTDSAFLLGPWIESARRLGEGRSDCVSSLLDNPSGDCQRFLEWNARTQITTWKPASKESTAIPQGPIDYAAKHWQGLIRDYYARRAQLTLEQAVKDEAAGRPLNKTAINLVRAQLAYAFTTSDNKYPMSPIGKATAVSRVMYDKYAEWFVSCDGRKGDEDGSQNGPEPGVHVVAVEEGR